MVARAIMMAPYHNVLTVPARTTAVQWRYVHGTAAGYKTLSPDPCRIRRVYSEQQRHFQEVT